MLILNKNQRRKIIFYLSILCLCIKFSQNTESLFSYGMQFAKIFKLNNGNIIVVGTLGINTYDSSGMNSLYNYSITENQITDTESGLITNFAQFSNENNGIGIVMANYILYILNSDGRCLFKYKPEGDLSKTDYFSIIPYIFKDNYYHFILGYISSNRKAFLQYYLIDLENEILIPKGSYEFDSEDSNRSEVTYDNGISCEFMNHNTYKIVLTCFFKDNYLLHIAAFSFKIKDYNIEMISDLTASYEDFSYNILSAVSPDRKNSLVCYISSNNGGKGYCSVYNIDDNSFNKYDNYISSLGDAGINKLSLNYFKETKEYIFSTTYYSPEIYVAKFDENFNIIKVNGIEETTLSITDCYSIYFYSIIFLLNDYRIIGDFSCNGNVQITTLYSIPDEYKPLEIYSDIPEEISLNEDESNSSEKQEETTTKDITNIILNSNIVDSSHIDDSQDIGDSTDISKENSDILSFSLDSSEEKTTSIISSSSNELISNCTGYKNSDGTICSETIPFGYYIIDIINKILGKCHVSCQSCEKGPEEDNNNCISCKENFELNDNNNCLYKYNYYFDDAINEIIYLLADELCPEKLPYEKVETKQCVESCTNEELINKKCIVNYFSENNINLISDKVKTLIKDVTDSDYDVIVDGNNIIYEITSSSSNHDYNNVSKIDFGECENILKKLYSIDYLLIFKMDVKLNDSCPTVVEYEVYSPETKEQLNLSLCENSQIDVYIPVNLDDKTLYLYSETNQFGYDIFDKENSFYNDICSPFTSDDGTDIILSDRQNTYYNNSLVLCESSCTYKFYNISNGKAKCLCQIKNEISKIKTISYDTMDINNFLDLKTISNIELIKCYKLTFSKAGITKNYGNIILLINIGIFIFFIIFHEIYQKKLVSHILRLALLSNGIKNPPKKKSAEMHFRNKKSRKSLNNQFSLSKNQSQTIRDLIETNQKITINKRKSNKKITDFPIQNFNNLNFIHNENYIINDKISKYERKRHSKKTTKKSELDVSIYKIKEKSEHHQDHHEMDGEKKSEYNQEKDKEKDENHHYHEKNKEKNDYHNHHQDKDKGDSSEHHHFHEQEKEIKYNDYELNNLVYKDAIEKDKRDYFQYYCSLLKTKHIVLSIFLASNDYNLITIKLSLFIFSFCLYFTVNALFFTDKTMHKIYENKGIFDILIQLPHILYSTLISAFINMLTKKLALSEKDVLKIKEIKIKEEALEKSAKMYRNLMIKFNIFFGISLLFLGFFWYYVTTFCAVYKNTQIPLIINTLSCFLLSLLYPFALNLLPGMFRIPALKSEKKDKECEYNIGNLIALI